MKNFPKKSDDQGLPQGKDDSESFREIPTRILPREGSSGVKLRISQSTQTLIKLYVLITRQKNEQSELFSNFF